MFIHALQKVTMGFLGTPSLAQPYRPSRLNTLSTLATNVSASSKSLFKRPESLSTPVFPANPGYTWIWTGEVNQASDESAADFSVLFLSRWPILKKTDEITDEELRISELIQTDFENERKLVGRLKGIIVGTAEEEMQ